MSDTAVRSGSVTWGGQEHCDRERMGVSWLGKRQEVWVVRARGSGGGFMVQTWVRVCERDEEAADIHSQHHFRSLCRHTQPTPLCSNSTACLFICMYIMCAYVCAYVCVRIYIYIYICIDVYMCTCACVHMCVYMYVNVIACI